MKRIKLFILFFLITLGGTLCAQQMGTSGNTQWLFLNGKLTIQGVTGTDEKMANYFDNSAVPWKDFPITSVELKNVSHIGQYAFSGLDITSITIPKSVTSIGGRAFLFCSKLTTVVSEVIEPFTFANSVFQGINDDCVLMIPAESKDAYIAAGWTNEVFKGGLRYRVRSGNVRYVMDRNDGTLTISPVPGTDGVAEEPGYGVWNNNEEINSVVIEEGVTKIPFAAFMHDTRLKTVSVPNSLVELGQGSFLLTWFEELCGQGPIYLGKMFYSANFTSSSGAVVDVEVKEGTLYMNTQAFSNSAEYGTITIPSSVKNMGDDVFRNVSVEYVVAKMKNPCPFKATLVNPFKNACALYVPAGTKDAYIAAGWTTDIFKGGIVEILDTQGTYGNTTWELTEDGTLIVSPIPDTNGAIPDAGSTPSPWAGYKDIKALVINDGVTAIGQGAFTGCKNLTTITVANTVNSVVKDAFEGTAWMDNSSDDMLYVGKVAYRYIGDDPSVEIAYGTVSIAEQAFNYKTGLTSIIIPNTVTSIGELAFRTCDGLTELTLPSHLESLGDRAFSGCTNLTRVISMNPEPPTLGRDLFGGRSVICQLSVPEGTRDAYIAAGWTEEVFHGGIIDDAPEMNFGDANGDGAITITDALAIVYKVLNKNVDGFNANNADMDDSGDITITDALSIVKKVLGNSGAKEAKMREADPQ